MASCVFCLIPQESVFNKINDIKRKIKEIAGNQFYLDDPPHVTIYLGNFKEIPYNYLDSCFNKLFSKKIINFKILSLRVFEKDPITNQMTLFYPISPNKDLFDLQKNLLEFLKDKRLNDNLNRYKNLNLREDLKKNLEDYGYPFVGEIWIPHISLASVHERDFKRVLNVVSNYELEDREYKFDYFIIYELNEAEKSLKEYRRYKLK